MKNISNLKKYGIGIALIISILASISYWNKKLVLTTSPIISTNLSHALTLSMSGIINKGSRVNAPRIVQQTNNKEELTAIEIEIIKRHITAYLSALNEGDFNNALTLYKKIIQLTKNDPAYTGGDISNKTLINKITSVEEGIKTTQDSSALSKLYLEKGITEYGIGNHLYYSQDSSKYKNAIIYYWLRAIESLDQSNKFHDNALAHRYKGVVIMDIGVQTEIAIAELKKAISLDDRDVVSHYKLGNAYINIDKYDLAINSYLRGIDADSTHEYIQENLSLAYFYNGDTKNGYKVLRKLLTTCKDTCHVANYNLANQLLNDGEKDEAIMHYKQAIKEAEKKMVTYRNAYRQLGKALYLSLRQNEAIYYLKASFNNPNDPPRYDNQWNQNTKVRESYYYTIKTLLELQNYTAARMYLNNAVLLYPNDADFINLSESIEKK